MKRTPLSKFLAGTLLTLAALMFIGAAFAQEPQVLDPQTWYVDDKAVMAVGVILAGYVVNILTALGKAAWVTSGNRTRYLAIAISAVVAGIGGYFSLGYLSDVEGINGALRAVVMTLGAAVLASVKYEADKLTIAKGVEAAAAKAKLQG